MEISSKTPELATILDPNTSAEKTASRLAEDTTEAEVKAVDDKVDIKVKDVETEDKVEEKRAPSEPEPRRADDTLRSEEETVDNVDFKDKEAEALKKISVYA